MIEESPFFDWKSREIYDVEGRLLFRDHIIDLIGHNELRVRTAASDLLRTPVWSLKAGPALDVEGMMEKTLAVLRDYNDLLPLLDDEEGIRLVSYSYPKLGILCYARTAPHVRFVIDIAEPIILPLDSFERQEHPESPSTVWSPYDEVVTSKIAQFRSLWERNVARLAGPLEVEGDLRQAVRAARAVILEEKTTNPELILIGQQTEIFCAAASVQMILKQHGIDKTQDEVAAAMNTGPHGADPADQEKAISILTDKLEGELDLTASLDVGKSEIRQHRPFKTAIPGHARACGGFKVEEGGRNSLYIYDPYPPNQGDIYYEDWDAVTHTNNIYIRPVQLS